MANLYEQIVKDKSLKIVSFDIFDTLLFRCVSLPRNIFEYMYEKKPELFPDFISKEDWKELRCAAESFAKSKLLSDGLRNELTLENIYSALPNIISYRDELMKLEIQCEKEYTYINPYMAEMIGKIRNNTDCIIILTSDMYLNKDIISEILITNEFNLSLVDKIYVSTDYNASKKSGDLFEIVIKDLNIAPEQMIHIGDNLDSDIKPAIKKGIKTYLYDVVSGANQKFPYILLEELKYSVQCEELFALRNLVASYNSYSGEQSEWYNMGSMVLGPVFTAFAEWVLDTAEKEKINNIFPIMREGKFLSELLCRANKFRNNFIKIEPIYTSRKALYQSILNIVEKRDIRIIANSDLLTFNDVLKMLNIEEMLPKNFKEYSDISIQHLKKISLDGGTVYDKVDKWLTSEEVIQKIREKNINSDELMMEYITELGFIEPYMTLDIGWRGSVADGIQRMLLNNNKEVRNINLLMFGRLDAMPNVFNNCEIRGYIGSFGKNLDLIKEIFVRVFECFVICESGTTMGYERVNGKVVAKVEDVDYGDNIQFSNIRICQEGIMAYQKLYLDLKRKKEVISKSESSPEVLCRIMARLLTMPLFKESELLGNMSFDQNMGINKVRKIISEDVYNSFKKYTLDSFFSKKCGREVEWISGMNVLKNPFYNYKLLFGLHNMYTELKIISFVERIMLTSNEKFVIVGAGGVGTKILKYFTVAGLEDRIECFADNNTILQKITLYGKKVKAFDADFKAEEFIIASMDEDTQRSIINDILRIRGTEIKYYNYYEVEEQIW